MADQPEDPRAPTLLVLNENQLQFLGALLAMYAAQRPGSPTYNLNNGKQALMGAMLIELLDPKDIAQLGFELIKNAIRIGKASFSMDDPEMQVIKTFIDSEEEDNRRD